jgi:hypothetical protein
MAADAGSVPHSRRALIVSSFVLPRSGGVEQFVDVAARLLRAQSWRVRVLARPRTGEAQAEHDGFRLVSRRRLAASGRRLEVTGAKSALPTS